MGILGARENVTDNGAGAASGEGVERPNPPGPLTSGKFGNGIDVGTGKLVSGNGILLGIGTGVVEAGVPVVVGWGVRVGEGVGVLKQGSPHWAAMGCTAAPKIIRPPPTAMRMW
jgi:hypothetical protein